MGENDTTKVDSEVMDAEKMTKLFPMRVRTSAYNFERDGSLILREDSPVILDPRCYANDGIDLSGGSVTDSKGRMTWRLLNSVCPEYVPKEGFPIDFPLSFVATPMTDKPVYITVKFVGVKNLPKDVIFEVYSWNKQGQPAPFLPFYWRCRIPLTHIVT